MTPTHRPVVAIVGRPNVGKSTLVNRMVGRRVAIVEERPGVTRDRKSVEASWTGRDFDLWDTGGWLAAGSELDHKVSRQAELAMGRADLLVMVVDATVGVTEDDARVADLVRRSGRPVILVANKVDDRRHEAQAWELLSLGLGDPVCVSALHGRGTGDLLDGIVAALPEEPGEEDGALDGVVGDREPEGEQREGTDAGGEILCSVTLVGRPNVGKSTLFNRLIGEDRSIVHDMPGTTRDTIDTLVDTEIGRVRFIDTAGMRRKSRIKEGTEYFSLVRALQAVDKADVALLVIDASEGVTHQDQRLAERVDAAGCPIVVILNKWETLDQEHKDMVEHQFRRRLGFLGDPAMLRLSALTGRGVHRLIPALDAAVVAYRTRIPTSKVMESLRRAQQAQPAPHGARVLYATQGATDPPTFTLFVSKDLPATYLRFLERTLREDFDLGATPVKLRVRRRGD